MTAPLTARALQVAEAVRIVEQSWRRDGCGPRCARLRVRLSGREFWEWLPVHDPDHHEGYGEGRAAEGRPLAGGGVVRTGPLVVDGQRTTVEVGGEPVRLTPRELQILMVLAARLDQTVRYRELALAVFASRWADDESPSARRADCHALSVHVTRLRRKLGPARDLVLTVPNVGLRLLAVDPEVRHAR